MERTLSRHSTRRGVSCCMLRPGPWISARIFSYLGFAGLSDLKAFICFTMARSVGRRSALDAP